MAMANPSYYRTAPPVSSQVQHQEHRFDLYVHQELRGNENTTVETRLGANNLVWTNIMDWNIREGPKTMAKIVGRARGMEFGAGIGRENWSISFTIVFTDERFKGSTLNVQGDIQANAPEGDWAVVGGTGEFAHAQGLVTYKRDLNWNPGSIRELHIHVVCLTFPKPEDYPRPLHRAIHTAISSHHVQNPIRKAGPWGGNGGTPYEIKEAELPQRLQSVTIYHDDVIQSIEFSYIDQAGKPRTSDPLGGKDGLSVTQPGIMPAVLAAPSRTIPLGSSETLKEIRGATGDFGGQTVVTSLTIVTNVRSYGPYGKQSVGNTLFQWAAPDNHSIVGFYGSGCSERKVVYQIGVYVCSN